MAQQLLYAPEAAPSKDGGLGVVVHCVVFSPKFGSGPTGIGIPWEVELMMILFAIWSVADLRLVANRGVRAPDSTCLGLALPRSGRPGIMTAPIRRGSGMILSTEGVAQTGCCPGRLRRFGDAAELRRV